MNEMLRSGDYCCKLWKSLWLYLVNSDSTSIDSLILCKLIDPATRPIGLCFMELQIFYRKSLEYHQNFEKPFFLLGWGFEVANLEFIAINNFGYFIWDVAGGEKEQRCVG